MARSPTPFRSAAPMSAPHVAPATTSSTPTWPIVGDAPDLQAIVQAQAVTISDQEALVHAYQGVLNAAQAPAPATGVGTSTGTTTLNVASAAGIIKIGAVVGGAGVPSGCSIAGQQSGPAGGTGTYTTSVATTLAGIALTFTPGGGPMPWPTASDAPTLNAIAQMQTAVLRVQSAMIQHYQDLLNTSATAPPSTGP